MIVLSGVSGSGKTHARATDPELRDLPYVDIADVYQEHRERWPEFPLDWESAVLELLRRVRAIPPRNDTVVVEGYFLPGSPSRAILINDLAVAGFRVEFREFRAPREVCELRIANQWRRGECTAVEANRRLALLARTYRE